jgi:K+-sensing histidine kinase KdpD
VRGIRWGSQVRSLSWPRAIATALVPVGLAALASWPFNAGGELAVSLSLLAVVGAAAFGGRRGGLIAAGASTVVVTILLAPARRSLDMNPWVATLAGVAFLAASVIVGGLVAGGIDERHRAAAGERDARLLGYLATRLLSGEPVQRVLDAFAQALLEPLDLAGCEVHAKLNDEDLTATAGVIDPRGPSHAVPIVIGQVGFGTVTAVRDPGGRAFSRADMEVMEAAAKQAAMALERARMDSNVRRAQIEAETNQLRAALFSSVTHDLKTPLAIIKAGATSLLSSDVVLDKEQERELQTTILEETDRLNRLIGNIMDLARIRAGALAPAREAVDLEEIVHAVAARMRPMLGGIQVRTNIRPEVPEVYADPVQVDQVLTNLLENAVRHSPAGAEVLVSAARYRETAQVRIADQGSGIPPQDREQVFEAFYRRDPASSGSGLGLAIARAMVMANGGRIWIEGAPGGGAAVLFELPTVEEAGD